MMSLHEEDPNDIGVAFCRRQGREGLREQPAFEKSVVALTVGLTPEIYPSVCKEDCREHDKIFQCLQTLRDNDPGHQAASKQISGILTWDSGPDSQNNKPRDVMRYCVASSERT